MQNKLIIFLWLVLSANAARCQEVSCTDSAAMHRKLAKIRESDQQPRARLIREMRATDEAAIKKAAMEMKETDQQNQVEIAALLDRCGWPQGLTALENNTIFLVIDHADTAYASKYFPVMKKQADLGVVAKSDLATLEDRMQMRKGLKQLYGTQTFQTGGTVTIWPVADQEMLDERRKQMGLPAMEDYMSLLKNTYGGEVNWDKSMSTETAREIMFKKK